MRKTTMSAMTPSTDHEEMQAVADFIFGDRRTFFYMQEIVGEGRDSIERARILYEYISAFPPIKWDAYSASQRRRALQRVNWSLLARTLLEYDWFA